jgi:hypothetical protein
MPVYIVFPPSKRRKALLLILLHLPVTQYLLVRGISMLSDTPVMDLETLWSTTPSMPRVLLDLASPQITALGELLNSHRLIKHHRARGSTIGRQWLSCRSSSACPLSIFPPLEKFLLRLLK